MRLLLLGDKNEGGQDDLINLLHDYAHARLHLVLASVRNKYGVTDVPPQIPEALTWIIDEVVAVRFNRIGSEGMANQAIGGHSVGFSSEDFSGHLNDLVEYVVTFEGGERKGREGRVIFH